MNKSFGIAVALLILVVHLSGQTVFDDGFKTPWIDQRRALVLDGAYYNKIDWEKLKGEPRVKGLIFRSTWGKWSKIKKNRAMIADCEYHRVRLAAKHRGYLWGSFHVGMSEDVMPAKKQAQFYLDNIDRADDELMALDLEDVRDVRFMTLKGAREFIQYIFDKTGRYPVVYITGLIYKRILLEDGNNENSVFRKTPLWFARPENNIEACFRNPTVNFWPGYTLWQFASELNCGPRPKSVTFCELPEKRRTSCPFRAPPPDRLPRVPGVALNMDINVFNGTVDDLVRAWPFTFREGAGKDQ